VSQPPTNATTFTSQYGSLAKTIFRDIVRDDLAQGSDAVAQARSYAARGKPDFVLAYLLAASLPDNEKRELLAQSYENRAIYTEERAREFDRTFHRSFALLFAEAGKDRASARQIRAGRSVRPDVRRQLPMA
jgi:hypothetical protein